MPSLLLLVAVLLAVPGTAAPRAAPVTPPYEGNCQSPRWAPDGARLAYEVNYHDRKVVELYVLTPGQGAPVPVRPRARGASSQIGRAHV